MQAPPPQPMQPHWIPIPPSWLVALGLIILAALPHQIPAQGRRFLQTIGGAVLWLALAVWIGWSGRPVLATAAVMLLVGVWVAARSGPEPFVAPVLNKDPVTRPHRWFVEEIMTEEPIGIQDRTEGPALMLDEVEPANPRWGVEEVLGEHPAGIQEKPVAELPEYDDSHPPYRS